MSQAKINEALERSGAMEEGEGLAKLLDEWWGEGVRILAVDFDRTLTSQHSGGFIDANEGHPLLDSMTPFARKFGEQAAAKGFRIYVVTFSDLKTIGGSKRKWAGEPLVHRVLERAGAKFPLQATFAYWPKNYQTLADFQAVGLEAPMNEDKSFHLHLVRLHAGEDKSSILLIDDDLKNCRHAVRKGYLAAHVAGDQGLQWLNLGPPF